MQDAITLSDTTSTQTCIIEKELTHKSPLSTVSVPLYTASWQEQEVLLSSKMPRQAVGTTQLPLMGTAVVSSAVKLPGHEVDHLPPHCTYAENEWNNTFTPPVWLKGLGRDNFTFTLFKPVSDCF